MARTVDDAALMLSVMAGDSSIDPLSGPVDASSFADLPAVDLSQLKVAWSTDLGVAPHDATETIGNERRAANVRRAARGTQRGHRFIDVPREDALVRIHGSLFLVTALV